MPDISPAVLNFNKNSGSNNLSKIVVEFGIFGAILLLTYLILISIKKNRQSGEIFVVSIDI